MCNPLQNSTNHTCWCRCLLYLCVNPTVWALSRIHTATAWGRFFPCPDAQSARLAAGNGSSAQHVGSTTAQHAGAPAGQQHSTMATPQEAAAGLQQGTPAWHAARKNHITGSQLADLLGFSGCPAANRVLCKHQVYHRVANAEGALSSMEPVALAGCSLQAGGTLKPF